MLTAPAAQLRCGQGRGFVRQPGCFGRLAVSRDQSRRVNTSWAKLGAPRQSRLSGPEGLDMVRRTGKLDPGWSHICCGLWSEVRALWHLYPCMTNLSQTERHDQAALSNTKASGTGGMGQRLALRTLPIKGTSYAVIAQYQKTSSEMIKFLILDLLDIVVSCILIAGAPLTSLLQCPHNRVRRSEAKTQNAIAEASS